MRDRGQDRIVRRAAMKDRDVRARLEHLPRDMGADEARAAHDQDARGHYLSVKFALRFSEKAAMPSFWSAVANMAWNSRRSKRTPSLSVVS